MWYVRHIYLSNICLAHLVNWLGSTHQQILRALFLNFGIFSFVNAEFRRIPQIHLSNRFSCPGLSGNGICWVWTGNIMRGLAWFIKIISKICNHFFLTISLFYISRLFARFPCHDSICSDNTDTLVWPTVCTLTKSISMISIVQANMNMTHGIIPVNLCFLSL